MRIALATDAWFPQVNGVVTTLNHVREELEAQGHEFLVIHPELFRTVAAPRYPMIRLSVLPGRGVARMLAEFAPQTVHIATEGPLGLAARRWCLRRGHPFTTSFHTQFADYLKIYYKLPRRLTYAWLRWFHSAAQRTLVPTPTVGRQLQERGFPNIVVWTRGVDTSLFQPRAKTLYSLPRPIFLYCGRVSSEKNIEVFLDAKMAGSKVVIGDGPILPALRTRHPEVTFVGFKHGRELADHFASADVFVFPSLTDTFGVVMLEANACGLPVAAYPVTGPIDVVQHGRTGFLHDDLAVAAAEALKLSPQMCRQYALEHTWRRVADMFLENLAPIGAVESGADAGCKKVSLSCSAR